MYCIEPASKKAKIECASETFTQNDHDLALSETEIIKQLPASPKSPILVNKERSFKKCLKNGKIMKRLSMFSRTVLDENNIVESKFFSSTSSIELDKSVNEQDISQNTIVIEDSPVKVNTVEKVNIVEKVSRNPFKVKSVADINKTVTETVVEIDSQSEFNKAIIELNSEDQDNLDSQLENSQKENSPGKMNYNSAYRNPFSLKQNENGCEENDVGMSEDFVENTYPLEVLITPVDSQVSYGDSQEESPSQWRLNPPLPSSQPLKSVAVKKPGCKVPGLKRTTSLPSNQPTLLSKFGFQKKPVLKQ